MTDPRPSRLWLGVLDYLGWRFSLLDDAGEQHILDAAAMWFGRSRKGRTREQLRVPRREIMPSFESFFLQVLVGMLLIAIIESIGNTSAWPSALQRISLAVVMVGAATAASAFIAARFRRRSGEYVKLMKARALCPACIYSLEGMQTDSEHMVTCPECGAKWRLDEVSSP